MKPLLSLRLAVLTLLALTAGVQADDTLTAIYSFDVSEEGRPSLSNPALIQGSDGNFYGTTYGDYAPPETFGTIFRLTPDGVLTTLHTFQNTDGANPTAALIQAGDGSFYGTTSRGGPDNQGTIFRLTPDGVLTTLHSFHVDQEGSCPSTALVLGSDGNFYGTTGYGGTSNVGTAYRLTPGGVLTTIHSFSDADGDYPGTALVLGRDGNFYGTSNGYTTRAGATDFGSVYRLTPDGAVTTLHRFLTLDEGTGPGPLLLGGDGNFYGTTYGGSTVYRLAPDGTFAILYTFTPSPDGYTPDGTSPATGLIQDGDGNLYGTTATGYDTDDTLFSGTVFRLAPDGTLTTLHKFAGFYANGGPLCTPLLASNGLIYGVTAAGGTHKEGIVFRVTTDSVATPLPPSPVLPVVTARVLGSKVVSGNGGVGEIQVTLDSALAEDLVVSYGVSGTASMETDYAELSGEARVKAGRTSKIIRIKPSPELRAVGKKTVVITLLRGDGYTVGTSTPLRVKIVRP